MKIGWKQWIKWSRYYFDAYYLININTSFAWLTGLRGPPGHRGPQGPVGPKGEATPVSADNFIPSKFKAMLRVSNIIIYS